MKISIRGLPKKFKLIKADFLEALITSANSINLPKQKTKISLYFTNDKTIAYYHAMYLDDASPTDVITFPMNELDPKTNELILGDIMISYETAEREAKQRKIPIQKELILYAIHGFLHLNGFDDIKASDRKKMHQKQNQILKQIYP